MRLLAFCLLACPAMAQDFDVPFADPEVTYTEEHDEGAAVLGVVSWRNSQSSAAREIEFQTSKGPLIVAKIVSNCNSPERPECADTLSLVSAPDGYTMAPVELSITETETARLLILPPMF